jgi:polar amino acid transport system permease protein
VRSPPPDRPLHGPRNSVIVAGAVLCIWLILAVFGSSTESGPAAALLLSGLWLTLLISLISILGGALIAAGVVVVRMLLVPGLWQLAAGYMVFFRGTPLIAQLYLVYYGAGEIHAGLEHYHLWWLLSDPLHCVLLTFILNTGAYQAHVVYGALRALPKEQTDAALALGLRYSPTLLKILLPQAMLIAMRPLTNEATKMLKASAIASVVTVFDLLGVTKILYNETFDFSYYYLAACVYLVVIGGVRLSLERLETYFMRHLASEPGTFGPPSDPSIELGRV